MANLFEKSICELSEMIRNKDCSIYEVACDIFDRIEETEPEISAYITLCKHQCLDRAVKLDYKIMNDGCKSPLTGIPIAIKDNICTAGVKTTCASKMLKDFVPPYNATVVEKLIANDMLIVGKVNMDEFAMGCTTETSYFHKTKNPINISRVPGGSSGGSAATVAGYQVPVSLGTDTGGSIRQPASFCGVVGLKPTYSSISRNGMVAFASSLDQIGPIARTVKDVALIYSHICGYDPLDSTSTKRNYSNFLENLSNDIRGTTIGISDDYFNDCVSDNVKYNINKAVLNLERHGCNIVNISLPTTKYAVSAYYIISSAEASSNLARFNGVNYGFRATDYTDLNDLYIKTRSQGFGEEVKTRIMIGNFVLNAGHYDKFYSKAKYVQSKIKSEFVNAFKKCDIIITPTTPDTAPLFSNRNDDSLKAYTSDYCTSTVNIAGLPAISIPCGIDKNQMPIGMQLIGSHFSEQTLFNVANFYQENISDFTLDVK